LLSAVAELTNKLGALESVVAADYAPPVHTPTSTAPSTVDYRILPDVGTSVLPFTGHETSSQAEDWISSVDGLAQVNQWPLRYRLLYVQSHVTEAARSWYLLEEFYD